MAPAPKATAWRRPRLWDPRGRRAPRGGLRCTQRSGDGGERTCGAALGAEEPQEEGGAQAVQEGGPCGRHAGSHRQDPRGGVVVGGGWLGRRLAERKGRGEGAATRGERGTQTRRTGEAALPGDGLVVPRRRRRRRYGDRDLGAPGDGARVPSQSAGAGHSWTGSSPDSSDPLQAIAFPSLPVGSGAGPTTHPSHGAEPSPCAAGPPAGVLGGEGQGERLVPRRGAGLGGGPGLGRTPDAGEGGGRTSEGPGARYRESRARRPPCLAGGGGSSPRPPNPLLAEAGKQSVAGPVSTYRPLITS